MKIVINDCFGGFNLNQHGIDAMGLGKDKSPFSDVQRDDPRLVALVEKEGQAVAGLCAHLKVVEIPDDVQWEIDEYDGNETIHEVHRSWR